MKRHFVNRGDVRTACGKRVITYDAAGRMTSSLKVTDDFGSVSCRLCDRSTVAHEARERWLDNSLGRQRA